MASAVYLPSEILVHILSYVASYHYAPYRQHGLHACCLVSRQWYSAAIAFLYEEPELGSGKSFTLFTDTVCPPVGVRKSKWNLGALVHKLNLSRLVHHSSNSLTARLLGRVKENLEEFVAPRISFASNSLPSLSKCQNLTHLDLSLTSDPIPFPQLKKSLQNHRRLKTLHLPRSTFLNPDSAASADTLYTWPPNLETIQLNGTFAPSTISSFLWPNTLTTLSINECTNLSVTALSSLLSSPQLSSSLKSLFISPYNRNLEPQSINAIPAFLPGLTFLSVPGDLVEDSFFDILSFLPDPLSLEVLEFEKPVGEELVLAFSTKALLKALDRGLANLTTVGFEEVFYPEGGDEETDEIEDALLKRENGDGVYFVWTTTPLHA